MKWVWQIAGLGCCVWFLAAPLFSQSLFESSQSGSIEELVSNNFTLGGFFQSATYLSKSPETEKAVLQSAYARAGVLLDAQAGTRAKAHGEFRFRYGNEFGKPVQEVDLREAWIDLWAGPFSFRMGKLISPWGKGSVLNPVDRLSPTDPLVRSPEEDDLRLGIWALETKIRLGSSMNLTATWNPVYRPSHLLIEPVPMPAYVHFLEPAYPSMELREGNYGIKYDLHSTLADLSLYWYQGYHTWPGISYVRFAMDSLTMEPLELALRERAYRIRMAGLDFSLPLGNWILRGEGAWMESMTPKSSQEYIPFPELSYCAEIEHNGSTLNLIAGYHGKYILEYEPMSGSTSLEADMDAFLPLFQKGVTPSAADMDAFIRQQIGGFNRLYNYQVEKLYHSVYVVAGINLFYDKLELTLPLIAHLGTEEWILQPGLTYRPVDGLSLAAGYYGLFGPDDSLMDMIGPTLNAGYLALKITF